MKAYNPEDKQSIYEYARKLEGKTFKDICDEDDYFLSKINTEISEPDYMESYSNRSRKGGLGEIVEERYFNYKADNDSRADFPKAEVELKVTPYKENKNGSISAKERLIISMINYNNIVNMEFYNSNAWEKLKNVLLVYYKWDPKVEDRLDYIIEFIYMLSPEGEDLAIIKNDFNKIKEKILEGKAHELSEGDTMYLGAATKASTSKDRRVQPFSDIPAKPRAFSLKNSYMTYVLRNYILEDSKKEDKIIKNNKITNLEDYVVDKTSKYINKKDTQLFEKFFGVENPKEKNRYSRLALEMLKIKTKKAEEFEKANIEVRSVRVEENNSIIESMSFPAFNIMELIKQDWEDSDINQYFSEKRFLFVIYKRQGENYYFKGVKFWNMPMRDIEKDLKNEWERARDIFKEGVKFNIKGRNSPITNNLPKKSNTNILHVRPHARMAAYLIDGKKYGNGIVDRDTDILPNGDRMTKQSFWLNNDYTLKQIKDKLIEI